MSTPTTRLHLQLHHRGEDAEAFPHLTDPLGWCSLPQLAHLLGRPAATVRRWVICGTLAAFSITSYQDVHRHWWVRLPPSL